MYFELNKTIGLYKQSYLCSMATTRPHCQSYLIETTWPSILFYFLTLAKSKGSVNKHWESNSQPKNKTHSYWKTLMHAHSKLWPIKFTCKKKKKKKWKQSNRTEVEAYLGNFRVLKRRGNSCNKTRKRRTSFYRHVWKQKQTGQESVTDSTTPCQWILKQTHWIWRIFKSTHMGIFSRKKGNGGKNEGLWVVGFGVF